MTCRRVGAVLGGCVPPGRGRAGCAPAVAGTRAAAPAAGVAGPARRRGGGAARGWGRGRTSRAGFDEQEDEFVAAVEPVADGFGHGVGLVPDDGVAEDPAVVLEGEGDPPGQAEQVLGLHAGAAGPSARPEVGMHAARGCPAG